MRMLGYFFSVASTAQNSPELHFRFIISFIQLSLLMSLKDTKEFIFKNTSKPFAKLTLAALCIISYYCNCTDQMDKAYCALIALCGPPV